MKNKIVTLLCIMTILITTAGIALGSNRQAYDINAENAVEISVDQHIKNSDGGLVDNFDVIYPVAGEENALDRITTVSNNSIAADGENARAYVRTVFAFEAADLSISEFHEVMYIKLNQGAHGDNRTAFWDYSANDEWTPMTLNGKKYYMLVATYNQPLAKDETTAASLLKVGFESGSDNDDIACFGNTYEMMVKTQAIEASGYGDEALPEEALDLAFGEITSDNHPWKGSFN